MKVAIIQDWLTELGGAEKVLESIVSLYDGSIYTLAYNSDKFKNSVFNQKKINTSFIQTLPFGNTKYRNYLPLFPLAIEQFDLSDYDIVLSSSNAVAKGVLTTSEQLHICYCHSPIRFAWDLYHQYLKEANLNKGIKGLLAKSILHYIRNWDYISSNRVDHFIANSEYIKKRIKKIYNKDAVVIYPPVNVIDFKLHTTKEEYYFTASRMVPYKKIDIIVNAFQNLPNKKLIVVGTGPDFKKIKNNASKNVEFLGYQDYDNLRILMQKAKAFIFAAKEDFGIVPVEAMACGTPVIAYGKGGALETVSNESGIFFYEQNEKSLIEAINKFEGENWDYEKISKKAQFYSKKRFEKEYKEFVTQKYEEFISNR
ncbi:MAG: glycosyltransferase family 4 protein [bacterium]